MLRVDTLRNRFSLFGLVFSILMFAAPEAGAATYSFSGKFEQYCCNWPGGGRPGWVPATPTLNKINDMPFAGGGGGVTVQMGNPDWWSSLKRTAGNTLVFPTSAIEVVGTFHNTAPVFPGWISIYTAVNFKNEAGSMKPGGQTGAKGYCINFGGNPNCTDPADGGADYNGLLQYTAGPNSFGGTMRMLGGTPGYIKRTVGGTARFRKANFDAPLNQVGGPFSEYTGGSPTGFYYQATNPTVVTDTVMNPNIFAGIPWGTGVVYGAATGGTGPIPTQSFSFSGSNALTGGVGNITLISGSMVASASSNTYPVVTKLTLTVPEPGVLTMFGSAAGVLLFIGIRRVRSSA